MSDETLRIDKWLWFARFFKSRTLAAKVCASGRLRINGEPIAKAHHTVKSGDVLTFPQGRDIRVVRILSISRRRGPAAEARALYDDLEPPAAPSSSAPKAFALRDRGSGRPTKSDRRAIDRLRGNS